MTEEIYNELKEWEGVLMNAVNNSFIHMTSTDFNKIAAIYNKLFTPLRKGQMNCNTCRLNALRKLGEAYINYNKEVPQKKKAGRPKKIEE